MRIAPRVVVALGLMVAVAGCGSGTATPSVSPSASIADCAPGASCQVGPNGLPVGFVRLADVDPSILQEMRYTTAHNFVGTPIAGYDAADCWVTAQTADALKGIQQKARAKGYTLKVYDCY
ncbi:MAG: M15 family metallopeptidase, partial [Actinomycetes bacterium]